MGISQVRRGLFLLDSAVISLAPNVSLHGKGLLDVATGHVHEVNETGRALAAMLASDVTLADLAVAISERFGVSSPLARADALEFAAELHSAGLVSIRQSAAAGCLARLRQLRGNLGAMARALPRVPGCDLPTWRYKPTSVAIAFACIEAHMLTLLAGIVVGLAAGLFSIWRRGLPVGISTTIIVVLMLPLAYSAAVVASALLHELGHYWAAMRLGLRARSVFVRMFLVGTSFERKGPGRTAIVLAAGPLLAVTVFASLALLAWNAIGPASLRLGITYVCVLVAALHLASLSPLTAEGRRLVAAVTSLSSWSRATGGLDEDCAVVDAIWRGRAGVAVGGIVLLLLVFAAWTCNQCQVTSTLSQCLEAVQLVVIRSGC